MASKRKTSWDLNGLSKQFSSHGITMGTKYKTLLFLPRKETIQNFKRSSEKIFTSSTLENYSQDYFVINEVKDYFNFSNN